MLLCRFLDLSSVLEPGRLPKSDKSAILSDAIHVLNKLRAEAQELREKNQKLREEIKTLKVRVTHITWLFREAWNACFSNWSLKF